VRNHTIVSVDQRHPGSQIGHHHHPTALVQMARQIDAAGERDVFAVETQRPKPVVMPIKPYGFDSCPGSFPAQPKLRINSPFELYWLM